MYALCRAVSKRTDSRISGSGLHYFCFRSTGTLLQSGAEFPGKVGQRPGCIAVGGVITALGCVGGSHPGMIAVCTWASLSSGVFVDHLESASAGFLLFGLHGDPVHGSAVGYSQAQPALERKKPPGLKPAAAGNAIAMAQAWTE